VYNLLRGSFCQKKTFAVADLSDRVWSIGSSRAPNCEARIGDSLRAGDLHYRVFRSKEMSEWNQLNF
jgi:hypothetical protein